MEANYCKTHLDALHGLQAKGGVTSPRIPKLTNAELTVLFDVTSHGILVAMSRGAGRSIDECAARLQVNMGVAIEMRDRGLFRTVADTPEGGN